MTKGRGDSLNERRRRMESLIMEANLLKLRLRFEEAEALCHKILQMDPNCSEGHEILGDIHRSLGRLEEAMEEYKRAIELDPKNVRAQSSLAETSLLLAEQKREEKRLQELVEKGPERVERSPTLAALYSIFPGFGQLYNGDLTKGLTLLALFVSSLLCVGFLVYASLARLREEAQKEAYQAVRATFPYVVLYIGRPLTTRETSLAYRATLEATRAAGLVALSASREREQDVLRSVASSAARAALRTVVRGGRQEEVFEEAKRAALRTAGGEAGPPSVFSLAIDREGTRKAIYGFVLFTVALYIYSFFDAVKRAAESTS